MISVLQSRSVSALPLLVLAVVMASAAGAETASTPHWLWSSATAHDGEEVYLRKHLTIAGAIPSAKLSVACDNHATAWVNGEKLLQNDSWAEPSTIDVAKQLRPGANVIAILAKNDDGIAGVVVRLRLKDASGKVTEVVSDTSWVQGPKADGWQTAGYDDASWKPAFDLGRLGREPWGDVFKGGGAAADVVAASALSLPPGFTADLVYAVPKAEQGSWVSLATDNKGRLISCDQNGSLYRITPAVHGADPESTKVERIDLPIGQAHGLLYAFDSLYVMVNGKMSPGKKSGLYRLQDTMGDDHFDKITKLCDFDGEGEHGPHSLVLGPDHKIYFTIGNHTRMMAHVDVSLPAPVYGDDFALPRHWDPNGHARGIMAPGGYIGRTDAEGRTWELVSMGYRNIFDLGFDPNGELFTWDADMEWDMGAPWYRPIRVVHATSGSDLGWRSGSGKYPAWYADSLPPLLDVGPGSPTGMVFGYGAKFPAKYQRAMFILDWTFGTIYAIHLQPMGASFTATKEEFVFGRPLPVTDVVIANDGNMYFSIGGRGTGSAIYRVMYTGTEPTAPVQALPPTAQALERHKLEAFHGHQDPAAVAACWPALGSADRFLRTAARIAIEHQPVAEWQDRALQESDPQAHITALVALARCAPKSILAKAYASFLTIDIAKLDFDAKLEALRALELLIIRLGMPDQPTTLRLVAELDPLFPASDYRLNRELSALLADLASPTIIAKVLAQTVNEEPAIVLSHDLDQLISRNGGYAGPIAQMLASKPQQMHIHYALVLSVVKNGWTPAQRTQYFSWFDTALNESKGGNSFKGFIRAIQKDALDNIPEGERQAVLDSAKNPLRRPVVAAELPQPKGPGHEWKTEELVKLAQAGMHKRSFENGKTMFAACQCTTCHRFAGDGGSVGPDLSSVATRFAARDIIESIIEPSKVISDQYQTTIFVTKDGNAVSGRLISDDGKNYLVAINPLDPSQLTPVVKAEVQSKSFTNISTMPPGLISRLNQDEALDLIAYLLASANPQDAIFK